MFVFLPRRAVWACYVKRTNVPSASGDHNFTMVWVCPGSTHLREAKKRLYIWREISCAWISFFFFSGLLLISPSGWRTHYVRWEIPHRLVWVSWLVRSSILYFIQKLALDAPYDGGAPRFSWGFSSRTIKTLPQKLICLENTETGTNTGWAMPLIWVYNENHAINNQFRSILDAFLSTCIYLQKLKKNGNIRKRLPTRATMGIHHILKFPTFGG